MIQSEVKNFSGFSPAFAEFSLKLLNSEAISCDDYQLFYQSFWKK